MIWSRYNYLFSKKDSYFLYNSLSNSFAKLDKELFHILNSSKHLEDSETFLQDVIDDLKRMKCFVEDDEMERLKIKYSVQYSRFYNKKLSLTICPTLDCNFSCPYCFERTHHKIYMSYKLEDSIVDFVKSHSSIQAIDVTWFGGEPLLNFKCINSLTRKLMELKLHYRAAIVTNGYLLSEQVVKNFEKLNIISAQITIDGMNEMHNKRRHLRNGHSTFDRIISNIIRASEINPRLSISIRVNIDEENKDEFTRLHQYIQRLGLKNVKVYHAFVNDYNSGCGSYKLDEEKRKNLLIAYSYSFADNSIKFYPGGKRSECAVRNPNSYVIGPEGEIYKCWNDVGDSSKVVSDIYGNIRNKELLIKYLSGNDPLEDDECKECVLFPVCSGGCPYERLRGIAKTDICPLIKNNLEDFLWETYNHSYLKNN